MNIWLAKLGENKLSLENEIGIQNLIGHEFNIKEGIELLRTDYKNRGIHFISFDVTNQGSGKEHIFIDAENRLTSYSGLLVGTTPHSMDYRTVESIHMHSQNTNYFQENITGNYAVVSASDSGFQCFVDNLGIHKVYFFRSPDNHIYVTNFIRLLKAFKKSEINTNAFLDWITLESILLQETEEKNVFTLPYYGKLKWSYPDDNLQITQYKDVSELVYNDTPESILFDKVVSEFRSVARYISSYHNPTFTLSGGYDSRLILSMFWGLDNQSADSYSYYDNYYDVKIAKKIAKDSGIKHNTLEFTDELPDYDQVHNYLNSVNHPFFKYSEVFGYLVSEGVRNLNPDKRHRVLLKGTGGNSDRRIFEKNYLDNLNETDAISKLSENSLTLLNTPFFTRDVREHQFNRLKYHYTQKYMPVISGRDKHHKLKYLLFKERFEETTRRISAGNQSHYIDLFWPLTMDSFQTLLFNSEDRRLHRNHKNSIYHQLFSRFTNGDDKPIHFTSGLHWEASKLSRGLYRLRYQVIEKKLNELFNFRDKKTTHIKSGFYNKIRSETIETLIDSESSFLWDYLNRDAVIDHYQNNSDYGDARTQLIFKSILPILKLELDNSL